HARAAGGGAQMGNVGYGLDGERARRHRAHDRHRRRWHGERLSGSCARPVEEMMRLLVLVAACAFSAVALGQAYPNKPLKIVVGYPPGGSGDFLTRMAADELGKELGVAVVVENKPGAGGNIAHEFVARSPNDGYTILNAAHMAINRAMYPTLTYDPDKDFAAVTRIATGPTLVCVRNDSPIKDLKELIA